MEQYSHFLGWVFCLLYLAWVRNFVNRLSPVVSQPALTKWKVSVTQLSPEEACLYVSTYMGRPMNCSARCLRLTKYGRWGNNLLQLIHAARLANHVGYKRVFVPWMFLELSKPIMWNDFVEIVPGGGHTCVTGNFWGISGPHPGFEMVNAIPDEFRLEYLRRLNVSESGESTLVIHIRSGDIFVRPHGIYGQPPCVYYRDIINTAQWAEVTVTAEDRRNPCTRMIPGNVTWRIGNPLVKDLQHLLGARNLVIGRGTFGWGLMMLSVGMKRLFTFNQSEMFVKPSSVAAHVNCVPTQEYAETILQRWTMSPQQLQIMTSTNISCAQWVTTEYRLT